MELQKVLKRLSPGVMCNAFTGDLVEFIIEMFPFIHFFVGYANPANQRMKIFQKRLKFYHVLAQ